VTDTKFDNFFSTKNLYSLPTYYNCGVGSAGFGVFRELVAHIKTTNLDSQIETFPFTLVYRAYAALPENDKRRLKSQVGWKRSTRITSGARLSSGARRSRPYRENRHLDETDAAGHLNHFAVSGNHPWTGLYGERLSRPSWGSSLSRSRTDLSCGAKAIEPWELLSFSLCGRVRINQY
jgi:hypothetical protein